MNKITLKSNAKINLGLNVTGKYDDDYHSLDMVMAPISLSDNLIINLYDYEGDLEIKSDNLFIPNGNSNIIYQIYNEFYNYVDSETKYSLKRKKIKLFLEKKIPFEAGLGGGSSNGAIFLKYLNSIYENILSDQELNKIGSKIGADIPFFLKNETSRVKGKGELLFPIENNLNANILIIKPEFGISTKEAYKNVLNNNELKNANIEKIIEGLKKGDLSLVEKNIENSLEQNLLLTNQKLLHLKNKLNKILPNKFFMTGSGSVYYALFDQKISHEILDATLEKMSESLLINYKILFCNFL